MNSLFLILLAVVGVVALWGVGIYNGLVSLRNRALGAWSDIEVQLKRRHDLVGNLVETVKGYAAHERGTFEAVVAARNKAVDAAASGDPAASAAAEGLLMTTLRQLFALAEAYPDLKASTNFMELQQTLGQLEDAIQNARRYYNAVVRDFNTRIQSFPNVLIARQIGFKEMGFFELEEPTDAAVPQVSFGQ